MIVIWIHPVAFRVQVIWRVSDTMLTCGGSSFPKSTFFTFTSDPGGKRQACDDKLLRRSYGGGDAG